MLGSTMALAEQWPVTVLPAAALLAILATGIMLLAFHSLFSGLILDTVTHGRREMKRVSYLSIPRRAWSRDLPGGSR